MVAHIISSNKPGNKQERTPLADTMHQESKSRMKILILSALASLMTTIMLTKQSEDWSFMEDLIDDMPKLLQNSTIKH